MIAYFFTGIFIAMIGYFCYFQIAKSESFINSPYNARLDHFSDRVIRGDILASDGTVLATTEVTKSGKEIRKYPYANQYAHVIGYAQNGGSGLESNHQFELLRSHSFILERVLNELEGKKNTGDSVMTTLNPDIQQKLYDALGDHKGAAIVMEPSTGKILAMVSKPDFDPNRIVQDWNKIIADDEKTSVLLNRATQGLYPPGSTFKLITALEYIRENPNEYKSYTYDCTGEIAEDNHTIHCYNNAVHGSVNLRKSLAKSCNSSFANIGLGLDLNQFELTCKALLFNETLPFHAASSQSSFSLEPSDSKSLIMSTAIGQGDTLVSPLHMALVTSAIANNGVLMTPYVVDGVISSDGNVLSQTKPATYRQLMNEKEAHILRSYMKTVVDEGTASALQSSDYQAYGKTGSAEYGTNKGDSHAWFVGFANAKGKESIAISVVVEEAGNGSRFAVPIAKAVFDTYFK